MNERKNDMRNDVILSHEDWQELPIREFIRGFLARKGLPQPGNAIQGEVPAHVNAGRWLVDCPTQGCGGAVVVSFTERFFVCPTCGSPENGGAWYKVTFPPQQAQIEQELLKRPSKEAWLAPHRNWELNETVEDLRQQNRDKGIKEDSD